MGALLGLASMAVQAGLVARWAFDSAAVGDAVADASSAFTARITNASGKAGLQRVADRGVFQVPGTDARDCLTLGRARPSTCRRSSRSRPGSAPRPPRPAPTP